MQQFPRGFVWSRGSLSPPEGYVAGPLENLFVCKDLAVSAASDANRSVTILGLCVGIEPDIADPAQWLLSALEQGTFYEALDLLCGRFAVFVKDPQGLRIVSDATGMRAIFYRRDFEVVASHARLVANERTSDVPFRYGFPGNGTPFPRVKLLTPNTLIELPVAETRRRLGLPPSKPKVRRFWPRTKLVPRTPEEAAGMVLDWTTRAVRKVAEAHPIRLALTAGLDSRVMLAVLLRSGVPFETYTYGGGKSTARDIAVASDLARTMGVRHSTIPVTAPHGEMLARLEHATYACHHYQAVQPLAKWIGDSNTVAVTANLLEIGRTFYAKMKRQAPTIRLDSLNLGKIGRALYAMRGNPAPPVSPWAMRALHLRSMPTSGKEAAKAYPGWSRVADEAFKDLLTTSNFNAARGILDPFDQFYWEHRMAAWHGVAMLERDFYAQAFIPFNARAIWEVLLGVPYEDRVNATAFHRMIDMVDPRLMDIPINPKDWPVPAPA